MANLNIKKTETYLMPHPRMIKIILQHLGYDVDNNKVEDAINTFFQELQADNGIVKGDATYRIMPVAKS